MSILIVELPPSAGPERAWVLSADGATMAGHGHSPLALLPAADEVVALVPWRALSWHRVALPKLPPARLRAALDGLLEDHLLDEPVALHLALAPALAAQPADGSTDPAAGSVTPTAPGRWVAACDRAWLRAALAELEAVGRPASRVLPEFAPGMAAACHIVPGADSDAPDTVQAWAITTGDSAPQACPLAWAGAALDESMPLRAEPAVAAQAEAALGRRIEVRARPSRWLDSLRDGFDLAQFDLALAGRGGSVALRRSLRDMAVGPAWRLARWGAGAALAVQLIGLNAYAWQQQRQLDQQREQSRALLSQTFPGVKVIVDAPLQMERELALLRQAGGQTSARDLEALLGLLAPVLGAQTPAGLEYAAGELRLKGLTLADEALAGWQRQLPQLRLRRDGSDLIVTAGGAT